MKVGVFNLIDAQALKYVLLFFGGVVFAGIPVVAQPETVGTGVGTALLQWILLLIENPVANVCS